MACSNCGCKNKPCGCEDTPLTSPAPCNPIGCPDPYPCTEVINSECVVYTGGDILCGQEVVVSANSSMDEIYQAIVDFVCGQQIISADITCGQDTIVTAGTLFQDALAAISDYFCDALTNINLVQVVAGDNTNVTSNTVGNTTTYTVYSKETIVAAGTDIAVSSSTTGYDTTYTVSVIPKDIQYYEHVENALVNSNDYYFPTVGYSALTYTNTSGVVKKYKVHGSYDSAIINNTINSYDMTNWVDGGIIKTVSAVDSVLWESLGLTTLSGFLYWGPNAADIIGSGLPIHKLLDDQGSEVQFRFLKVGLPRNVSFFQLVTLNPGESVSLKFKAKNGSGGNLIQAQFLVEEV